MDTQGRMAAMERVKAPRTSGSDGPMRMRAATRVTEVDSRWAEGEVEAEVALDPPAQAMVTTTTTTIGSAGAEAQGEVATTLAVEEMIVEIVVVTTTLGTRWRRSWGG